MTDVSKSLKFDLKHYIDKEILAELQREFAPQGIIVEEEDRFERDEKTYLACKLTCLCCKSLNEENVYFAQGLMSIKNSALSLKNHCFPTPSVKFRKHARNLSKWHQSLREKSQTGLENRRCIIDLKTMLPEKA